MLVAMDKDDNGVDKLEYLVEMLVMMELVDRKKLEGIQAQFDLFDTDGSGTLDMKDLEEIAKMRQVEKDQRLAKLKARSGVGFAVLDRCRRGPAA